MSKVKKRNFFLTPEGRDYLTENYVNGTKSVPEMAKEHKTYPNFVYRAMKHWGIPRKDRSEAQKKALASGRSKHPTQGITRPAVTKRKIGRTVFKKNQELSEEEKKRRIDICRQIWLNKDEEERKKYTKKSHDKIREAGKTGSKFEKYIMAALTANKFKVQVHHKLNFADSERSVDLFLPVEGICIEVDGPIHFEPLFGQKTLDDRIQKDLEKNELLLAEGYSLIRIQNPRGYVSTSFVEEFIAKFIPFIKQIAANNTNSFHEIHVDDFKGVTDVN